MRNQTGIRGESQKEKKAGRWKLLPVVLVIVGVVVAAVCLTSAPFSSKSSRTVIAGGETYVQRADITTILLLGIDKRETLENESGRPADNGLETAWRSAGLGIAGWRPARRRVRRTG